jgi:hypothetical protein
MPLHRMLSNGAFDPEAVNALTAVYEDVCATLRVVNSADPVTQMIAKKIFDYATRGQRDPIQLRV